AGATDDHLESRKPAAEAGAPPAGPDQQPHPKPVVWGGSGASRPIQLALECSGCPESRAVQVKATAGQAALGDALKTEEQNVSVETATYTQVPVEFLDAADFSTNDKAFQLMFRSDGRALNDNRGFGRRLQPSETLKCAVIAPASVAGAVAEFNGVKAIL